MLRKVYLEGEIGDKFGNEFTIFAKTPKDIFKCLDGNFPFEFRKYITECSHKNVGFIFDIADKSIGEEELLLSLKEGDVVISSIPAGSGGGVGKILAAVAIGALIWFAPAALGVVAAPGGGAFMGAAFTAQGTLGAALAAGGTLTTTGLLMAGVAVSLAMSGLQQLMAPDPAKERSDDESYLFNGSEQNIVEGDPVPILYGKLKIPGQPISFSVINATTTYNAGADTADFGGPLLLGQGSFSGYRLPLANLVTIANP